MAMDCQQIIDLLADYIDGELPGDQRRRLESHLDCCDGCVEFVDSYRKTGVLCRNALRVEMPQSLKSTLLEFLRNELQSPQT